MTENVNKHLLDNISIILKKSLNADATLTDLRTKEKAGFKAVFTKDAGFNCSANTFQPYVEEVADDYMAWQKNQNEQLLISIVNKIEQLFKVLSNFEHNHSS